MYILLLYIKKGCTNSVKKILPNQIQKNTKDQFDLICDVVLKLNHIFILCLILLTFYLKVKPNLLFKHNLELILIRQESFKSESITKLKSKKKKKLLRLIGWLWKKKKRKIFHVRFPLTKKINKINN